MKTLSYEGNKKGAVAPAMLRGWTSRIGSLATRARVSPEGIEGSDEASLVRTPKTGSLEVGAVAGLEEGALRMGFLSTSTTKMAEPDEDGLAPVSKAVAAPVGETGTSRGMIGATQVLTQVRFTRGAAEDVSEVVESSSLT
ncbi:hypothetical protein AMTR_s00132p00058020 [Amborella trichopoda]|uniref:Uncharacterized protein n=1 Tax=Amborella trichopoda TaxID=13333 RepID=W1NDP9_AMBTC|nr:hypothetical protein AMTR_s00132p00058020 [Amborella trichopoda]